MSGAISVRNGVGNLSGVNLAEAWKFIFLRIIEVLIVDGSQRAMPEKAICRLLQRDGSDM
jgi:hypothetical protein